MSYETKDALVLIEERMGEKPVGRREIVTGSEEMVTGSEEIVFDSTPKYFWEQYKMFLGAERS